MGKIGKGVLIMGLIALLFGGCAAEKTVGRNIKLKDVTEFYRTDSAMTDPPRSQRYHFHIEDGKYLFTHEKREGASFFDTNSEADESGTLEMTEEEWEVFLETLEGGTVVRRDDPMLSDGKNTALYIYWTGDKGEWQVFSFADNTKYAAFESLCFELKGREMSGQ